MVDWAFIWQRTLTEFWLLLKAPLHAPEMWWIITPLIVITFVMAFYFGKYIREKLGWNTALGNSIVLLFVSIDLLRTIYQYTIPASWMNFLGHPVEVLIIAAVIIEGLLLSYTAFEHALPAKVMFFIASPLPVNVQAYVLTAVVYAKLLTTWYTLLAAILLFAVLFIVLRLLQEIEHLSFGHHFKKKPRASSPIV